MRGVVGGMNIFWNHTILRWFWSQGAACFACDCRPCWYHIEEKVAQVHVTLTQANHQIQAFHSSHHVNRDDNCHKIHGCLFVWWYYQFAFNRFHIPCVKKNFLTYWKKWEMLVELVFTSIASLRYLGYFTLLYQLLFLATIYHSVHFGSFEQHLKYSCILGSLSFEGAHRFLHSFFFLELLGLKWDQAFWK